MACMKNSTTCKITYTWTLPLVVMIIHGTGMGICGTFCPDPWLSYDGGTYCYALVEANKKFHEADTYCRAYRHHLVETFEAQLAEPLTEFENVFIAETVVGHNEDSWIGVKRHLNVWQYISGTAVTDESLWEYGTEPTSNDCAVLHHGSHTLIYWHSSECSNKKMFVCQKIFPGTTQVPSTAAALTTAAAVTTADAVTTAIATTTRIDENYEISTSHLCTCHCDTAMTQEELQQSIEDIKTNLAVETSSLSSTQRKLISADDPRTSSKYIGIAGAIVIGTVLSLLVLLDILTIALKKVE